MSKLTEIHMSRAAFVRAAVLVPIGLALGARPAGGALAQTLPATPANLDGDEPLTPAETEGPYFKTGSPETTTLLQPGMAGTPLYLSGQVLDPTGAAVAGALLDFWQADANGRYDNSGYTLRGHQFTDEGGNYTLATVVPGLYPGRTRHIHVKVQAANGPVLTTQLYFPDEPQNANDPLFDPALLLSVQPNDDGSENATFTFVIATS